MGRFISFRFGQMWPIRRVHRIQPKLTAPAAPAKRIRASTTHRMLPPNGEKGPTYTGVLAIDSSPLSLRHQAGLH